MNLEKDQKLFGRYKIIKEIGRGAVGVVYKACDSKFQNLIAIKSFNPQTNLKENSLFKINSDEWKKRFEREPKLIRKLEGSPHIVTIHDYLPDPDNDTFYIIMPYFPDSLANRLHKGKHLSLSEALPIMRQICRGIKYAHHKRVIHCDLKPANILFDQNRNVKITDFSIARVLQDENNPEMNLTIFVNANTSTAAGTLFYMSPEQFDNHASETSDIYALGAIFFRMLTGQHYLPFDESGTQRARARNEVAIYEEAPRTHLLEEKGIPRDVIAIILKALAKEPKDRFAQAGELLAALEKISGPSSAKNDHPEPDPQKVTGEQPQGAEEVPRLTWSVFLPPFGAWLRAYGVWVLLGLAGIGLLIWGLLP